MCLTSGNVDTKQGWPLIWEKNVKCNIEYYVLYEEVAWNLGGFYALVFKVTLMLMDCVKYI